MKVLMVNGSPHENGCTMTALSEVARILAQEGIDTEIIQLGKAAIRDCTACGGCRGKGRCVFGDDPVNEFIQKAKESDGFIFGSPVYYAHPSGRVLAFLDRVFYAGSAALRQKPGAAVVSARRAGTTASLDALNKYFGISHMPTVGSTYWNMVHGNSPEEVLRDEEGMQVMRNLGRNMAWLIKCIELGKQNGAPAPQMEREHWTNFIR